MCEFSDVFKKNVNNLNKMQKYRHLYVNHWKLQEKNK